MKISLTHSELVRSILGLDYIGNTCKANHSLQKVNIHFNTQSQTLMPSKLKM